MSLNNLGLGIVLSAKDEFTATMERAQTQFGQTEKAADKMVTGIKAHMKTFALGAAIAAAGVGVLKLANDLARGSADSQLQIVQAARGAAEQVEALNKIAENEALKGMGTSADDAAAQLRTLSIQANLGAEAAGKALAPSILLAKASLGELSKEAAALNLGQILREFNLEAEQSGVVVDKLAVVSQMVGTNLKDLTSMVIGAAAGANLAGASLEDVAVAAALTNKALPDVGRATMAVNQAFLQLAGGKAAEKMKALGVDVIDKTTGKMRPLMEMLGSLNDVLSGMSEGKKATVLADIFGARGAGGIDTLLDQMQKGLKGANGEMATGSALAAELQARLQGSAGAAQQAAAATKGLYASEMKKLAASKSTMMDMLGDPLAAVLAPVLATINRIVTGINKAIASVPAPVKETIAKIVVAVGALMTAFGGFIAIKAALAMLPALFTYLGISLSGVLWTLAPLMAVFAAGALLVSAFASNARQAGEFSAWAGILRHMDRVKLGFSALMELMDQGGFSKKTFDELNKAENQGVMKFAIRVWYWVGKIQTFFEGLAAGFGDLVGQLEPAFALFVGALDALSEAFGVVDMTAKESADSWDATGKAGYNVGNILAQVARVLLDTITGALFFVAGAVHVVREAWNIISPVIMPVVRAVISAVELIGALFSGDWDKIWKSVVGIVIDAVDICVGVVGALVRAIAWTLDLLGKLVGKDLGLGPMIRKELDDVHAEIARFRDSVTGPSITVAGPAIAQAPIGMSLASGAGEMSPAVAMAAGVASAPSGPVNTSMSSEGEALMSSAANRQAETVNVNLILDGEVLAKAQTRREANQKARIMRMDDAMRGGL